MLPTLIPIRPRTHPLHPLHPRRDLRGVFIAGVSALTMLAVAGCAGPSATAPSAAPLLPPAAMRVEGVPVLLAASMEPVQRYSNVAGHAFVDWHPLKREMLISHREPGASVSQLYRVRAPLAVPERLTDANDPVSSASWEPRQGRYIVFARGNGGDEAFQLYRLDPETRAVTQLTPPGQRHARLGWLPSRSQVLVGSLPLDRTASAGKRDSIATTLSLIDPLQPDAAPRVIAELPGGGWGSAKVSPDERQIAITQFTAATESALWLINVADGRRRQLLPAPGDKQRASHVVAEWAPDGRSLFLRSDRASEFNELMQLDLASGALARVTAHVPWDVQDTDIDARGRWLALTANVDGRDELRLFDVASRRERPVPNPSPSDPVPMPAGSVGRVAFHPGSGELAMVVSSAQGPAQVHTLDPDSGRVQRWTTLVGTEGLDLAELGEPQIVRWKSFDGLTISGILHLPPERFGGRRPVVMVMHGGPEGQAKLGWRGRNNHLVQTLGVAVLEPNVRGSSGYGKRFLDLDNGNKREDSVKDMGSALDWIATQPRLDPERVIVTGGSYGGYMALAASVRLGDRIAGAASTVGISNWVTFLERTESYRRDLRRAEYGDERDPAMRAFLQSISPLNLAGNITKPLLVAQGKNDPRVPWTESEQIVRNLQSRGLPVWYLLADNEGHGFARRENADFYFATLLKFIDDTLLR